MLPQLGSHGRGKAKRDDLREIIAAQRKIKH